MSSKPVKVLMVDNDTVLRRTLRGSLAAQGYFVSEAASGEEALREISRRQAEIVLLDVEMPGMGGIEACRRLRSIVPQVGIIMVTVRDTEEDMIRALEAGADDYITKPFSLPELLARLRAVARRVGVNLSGGPAILRIGNLELDLERRSFWRAGVAIHLSPTEFALLAYLMRHANIPIEHGKLLREIWGPEYGRELEYLRTYIRRLRKKIESDALNPEYLLTVPWHGYQFHDPASANSATLSA